MTSEAEDRQWILMGDRSPRDWARMVAHAIDEGRRVEFYTGSGWMPTFRSSEGFRHTMSYARCYRIEAPSTEKYPY